jgi:hypothetical protein
VSVPRPVTPPAKLAINSIECSPAVTRRNMQQLSTIPDGLTTDQISTNAIYNQQGGVIYKNGVIYGDSLTIGGADATGKVKFFADDDLNYLPVKCEDANIPDAYAAGHLIVEVDFPGDPGAYTARWYIRPNAIHNYNDSATIPQVLAYDKANNRWTFLDPDTGSC